MRDDDPEDTLGDVFLTAMFGNHPVGRPVIGSVESISTMTRTQLHSFHLRRYTPERMVVAVAGNVDHDDVVALVREHFGPAAGRGQRTRRRRARAPAGCPDKPSADSSSTATASRPTCSSACGRPVGTGNTAGRCRCSTPRSAAG